MARPKKFDQEQALHNAMFVFWQKGYQATSVKDLENATGLVPSSIYNAFGSKEELFLQILTHYSEKIIGGRIARYLTQDDPIRAIKDFFTTCFTDLPKDNEGIACLMVNSASEMAAHHQGVRELVIKNDDRLHTHFLRCIEKAKSEKQLSTECDSHILASQLVTSLKGLLLSSKAIKNNNKMLEACNQSLEFILTKTEYAF